MYSSAALQQMMFQQMFQRFGNLGMEGFYQPYQMPIGGFYPGFGMGQGQQFFPPPMNQFVSNPNVIMNKPPEPEVDKSQQGNKSQIANNKIQ